MISKKMRHTAGNLLLFGCDIFPDKRTSELNFWSEILKCFGKKFQEVVVVSVNNRKRTVEKVFENITFYNLRPYFSKRSINSKDPEYSGQNFNKMPLALVYKTYSFWKYRQQIDNIISQHNIKIMHFIRIFGLSNRAIIKRHPNIMYSMTVPTHVDRLYPLQRLYHHIKNVSLKQMDRVVPTCNATKEELRTLGIYEDKMKVIRWTSAIGGALEGSKEILKERYGIENKEKVGLWSGPIQDTGAKEFFAAVEIARKVIERDKNYRFFFAFKPDKLSNKHLEVLGNSEKLQILETDRKTFVELARISDFFLSPVCKRNRTVAPPLTWIEMMGLGIPVITTDVAGAEELINHNSNGFIVKQLGDSASLILTLNGEVIDRVGSMAQKTIREEYCMKSICNEYVRMWKGL